MTTPRIIGLTIVVTFVVAFILAATFVYAGAYNVAASVPHMRVTEKILDEVSDRSIAARAGTAKAPPMDSLALLNGAEHFHKLCVVCHGAPGVPKSVIAEGLNPSAPELSRHAARTMTEAELFWVIRNGIRMTGMPGFEQSQTDEQIWQVAAFIKTMNGMSEAQYEAVIRAVMRSNGGQMPSLQPAPMTNMHH